MVVALLSVLGQKALGFHPKYFYFFSEDERRSYGFGTAWEWVIWIWWTIPLRRATIILELFFLYRIDKVLQVWIKWLISSKWCSIMYITDNKNKKKNMFFMIFTVIYIFYFIHYIYCYNKPPTDFFLVFDTRIYNQFNLYCSILTIVLKTMYKTTFFTVHEAQFWIWIWAQTIYIFKEVREIREVFVLLECLKQQQYLLNVIPDPH